MEGVAVSRQREMEHHRSGAFPSTLHSPTRRTSLSWQVTTSPHTCWPAQTGGPRENCEGAVGRTSGNMQWRRKCPLVQAIRRPRRLHYNSTTGSTNGKCRYDHGFGPRTHSRINPSIYCRSLPLRRPGFLGSFGIFPKADVLNRSQIRGGGDVTTLSPFWEGTNRK